YSLACPAPPRLQSDGTHARRIARSPSQPARKVRCQAPPFYMRSLRAISKTGGIPARGGRRLRGEDRGRILRREPQRGSKGKISKYAQKPGQSCLLNRGFFSDRLRLFQRAGFDLQRYPCSCNVGKSPEISFDTH